MILRRLGNKKAISKDIYKHFPEHKTYIEPFFGAGGMFFNKPKSKYNIVNDVDSDVFNLFNQVINNKEYLEKLFYITPLHEDLIKHWYINNETEPLKKAIRFLLLSNFTLIGNSSNLRCTTNGYNETTKKDFPIKLKLCFDYLQNVHFFNKDFRLFFKGLSFVNDGRNDQIKTLIYADPPYLGTGNNYSNSFSKNDFLDLVDIVINTGCLFAISEFDNDIILKIANENGLNIIDIGERSNIKNKRNEILITNYNEPKTLFDKN